MMTLRRSRTSVNHHHSVYVYSSVSVIVFQICFALYTGSFFESRSRLLGGDEYEREYCESLTPVCEFCL